MMSNRLSFNRAIARSTLRRCWPMWAAYLGFLLLAFPLPLLSEIQNRRQGSDGALSACRMLILNNGVFQAQAASVIAILAVMILFGYLYNSRGNTLMSSLPIRRESLFLTLYLTGLIPMLIGQLIVAAITMLLVRPYGIEIEIFMKWLACAALGLVAFYGFAVFCAMLTGNILILPAVYFVLNLTAIGFEASIRACLSMLVYGMSAGEERFAFLSPIVKISESLRTVGKLDSVQLLGLPVLAAYAAVGMVFALFAALLYRRRRMESVSDFVAIPFLKPVFRWCMGFGGAFLLAAFLFSNFFQTAVYGIKAACLMAGLLVIGAVLGWTIAEMLIRRTVRVFPLPWKGLCAVCVICVLTVFAAETDLIGYERFVPDPQRVAGAEFSYDTVFTDPENIRALTELHRELIEDKALFDSKPEGSGPDPSENTDRLSDAASSDEEIQFWVPIVYTMTDGSRIQRMYTIRFRNRDIDDRDNLIGSLMGQILDLINSGEGIQSRMTPTLPMKEDYVNYTVISRETAEGTENSYRLTPQETVELWNQAMLPDASEGKLSLYTIADTEKNLKTQTSLRIDISLYDREEASDPYFWHHSYRVFTFSERCLEWIEEHTGLEWETLDHVAAEREKETEFMK